MTFLIQVFLVGLYKLPKLRIFFMFDRLLATLLMIHDYICFWLCKLNAQVA